MNHPQKRVGVFGGSFNPPHISHLLAATWALATQDLDEIWLVPAAVHAFGKSLAPFPDRVKMCELLARRVRGLHVCEIESELVGDPLAGRTLRMLEQLAANHPGHSFSLLIGSDVLEETDRWYRWDLIQQLCSVIVMSRAGSADEAWFPSISSTAVRAALLNNDEKLLRKWLPRSVFDYLKTHGIYADGVSE